MAPKRGCTRLRVIVPISDLGEEVLDGKLWIIILIYEVIVLLEINVYGASKKVVEVS